jgi:hypothetical protein
MAYLPDKQWETANNKHERAKHYQFSAWLCAYHSSFRAQASNPPNHCASAAWPAFGDGNALPKATLLMLALF